MTKTSIEWTDCTWNCVRGCTRVSRGCEHCYAEGVARRFAGLGQPYEGLVRLDANGKPRAQWNGAVRFLPEKLAEPLGWRKPRRVFVNSMSDLFHESLTNEQIAAVFGVMAASQRHTFQVLTKRPARARAFFAWVSAQGRGPDEVVQLAARAHLGDVVLHPIKGTLRQWPWPLPNVWLGVSVEDQRTADERIPALRTLPAAVRWVSYEPALGPVTWGDGWLGRGRCPTHDTASGFCSSDCPDIVPGIDWIVVGGESGRGARPFDLAWARSTVAACREAGVACFVKQLGTDARDESGYALSLKHPKGGDPSEWPEDLRVREWPEVRHG